MPIVYFPRHASMMIIVECPKCSNKTAINGPGQHPVCDACDYKMTVYPNLWETILDKLETCHKELSPGERAVITLDDCAGKITYGPEEPTCNSCHTLLPVSDVKPGFNGKIQCTSCNKPTLTYPPPELWQHMFPSCRQIFGGEPDSAQHDALDLSLSPESNQPISMSCPSCSAGLSFPCTTTRRTTCRYCGVDVFIPDALWRRLHPVKRSEKWFVQFEGPSRKEIIAKSEGSHLFVISMLLTILAGAAALFYVIC